MTLPSLINDKKVVIVGAGPIGLTLARILQQSGADVTVYEREENPQKRVKGGTLDIHKSTGQKAIEKAGLIERFNQLARPTGERMTDTKGNVLQEEPAPTDINECQRPEIDRNDLKAMFLESLREHTVLWNRKFVSLEEKANGGVILHFDNNETVHADLVIGANGGMSSVRKYVTDIKPVYTGTIVIQGEVLIPEKGCSNFAQLANNGNLMTIAERKILYTQTKADGSIVYYVSFREPEQWLSQNTLNFNDKHQISEFLKEAFASWHDCYKELFSSTDEFTLLPMRDMILSTPWESKRNIVLVGDAAHVMSLFGGIGVNIGLLDALYLGENLINSEKKFTDIHSAIKDYEEKMFAYAGEAQRDSSRAEILYHSDISTEELAKRREEQIQALEETSKKKQ